MNTFKTLSLAASLLAGLSVPAMAGITINSPSNGESLASPFTLSATSGSCSSQYITAMGYSLDTSSATTSVNTYNLSVPVSASTGSHILHVKAWGANGASCVEDVSITVTSDSGSPTVPYSAATNSNLQVLGNWGSIKDSGTGGGKAWGSMGLTGSPSHDGTARSFYTTYSGYGGNRYTVSFGDDEKAENFFYDGWVYLTSSKSTIANLEMDMNQVMSDGETVIMGMQCDGWSGTWDYTKNAGSPSKPHDTWVHTGAKCNPRNWATNVWHHVQMSYSHNSSGVVTYKSVWLDGAEQGINATVPSAFALGWAPTLITNFQVDGNTTGTSSSLIYLDAFKISRW